MPRLHLLRHAKATRDGGLEDRDRPLARRGREEARAIAKRLPEVLGPIDLVLCSPALRTRETAELALAEFSPALRIDFPAELYLASEEALLHCLRRLSSEGNVLLIGHNPGLRDLAVRLADPASAGFRALAGDKFPTLACASFAIDGGWAEIRRRRHRLSAYVTPKSLGEAD